MNQLFTFDLANFNPDVLEGLSRGMITIRDGVAYWAEGAGKSGVAQWLPLKAVEFDPQQIENIAASVEQLTAITKAGQTMQLAATAISTGLIMGAIVVQTIYLSRKLDKLQISIDTVAKDVQSQNVIDYMSRISEYFGIVETARVLLLDKELVHETQDMAGPLLNQLASKRNELMSLIDNLLNYADNLTESHLEHMLDFITLVLDMIPKAIFIEAQLCDRYGKFKLANHLTHLSRQRYNQVLEHYRDWCNNKVKSIVAGKPDPQAITFKAKQNILKPLFSSTDNQNLLQQLKMPALESQAKEELGYTS